MVKKTLSTEQVLFFFFFFFWLSGRMRLPESLLSLFELPRLFQIENANSSPPVFSISTVARLESLRRFGFEWPLWMAPILA